MSRAIEDYTTPGADAALVAACQEFLGARAELDKLSQTGQGDGAAAMRRYCAALTGLSQAIPQSRGAFTAKAIAAHLATRSAKRSLPYEARVAVAGVMSAEARS